MSPVRNLIITDWDFKGNSILYLELQHAPEGGGRVLDVSLCQKMGTLCHTKEELYIMPRSTSDLVKGVHVWTQKSKRCISMQIMQHHA